MAVTEQDSAPRRHVDGPYTLLGPVPLPAAESGGPLTHRLAVVVRGTDQHEYVRGWSCPAATAANPEAVRSAFDALAAELTCQMQARAVWPQ